MKANRYIDDFGALNATFSRSDAEQRAMRLRDALLIPKGPRGPHAPHLEPIHMARLLIGLTAPDTATKAVEAVIEYANMSAIGERMFDGADNLEKTLAEIFKGAVEDEKFKYDVKEVIICRSWPEATIILTDGREFKFSTLDPPSYDKQLCRIDFHISWHFFHVVICQAESERDMQELKKVIKSNEDVEAYRQWKLKIIKIGDEQGAEAARTWMKENPFKPAAKG